EEEENEHQAKEDSEYYGLDPLTRPEKMPLEQWNGMLFYKELLKMLNAYLEQPVSENAKLRVLVALYEIVAARLDSVAGKLNLTLEQARKLKRADLTSSPS